MPNHEIYRLHKSDVGDRKSKNYCSPLTAIRGLVRILLPAGSLCCKAQFMMSRLSSFRDFSTKDIKLVVPEKHSIYCSPIHQFHIMHPYLMINWLNQCNISEII